MSRAGLWNEHEEEDEDEESEKEVGGGGQEEVAERGRGRGGGGDGRDMLWYFRVGVPARQGGADWSGGSLVLHWYWTAGPAVELRYSVMLV